MKVGLLDVNMLIALAWPSHVHHRNAHAWFAKNASRGWATCPLTECAFVRISSNPKIIRDAVTPREALTLLKQMAAHAHHRFWADDLPFLDPQVPAALLIGHRQTTDSYLLGLAIHHRGRLITLDAGTAALLPPGSPHASALEIVSTQS